MFYVLIDIANHSQLSRLNPQLLQEIKVQLGHIGLNRGGRAVREVGGQYLFSFHPTREKALNLVMDFMVLARESLEKRTQELFGYTILFETVDSDDLSLVHQKLKGLLFLSGRDCRLLAGPQAGSQFSTLLNLKAEDEIFEITGSQVGQDSHKTGFFNLLELTGWTEALRSPLDNLVKGAGAGRVLRLRGRHVQDKINHLLEALKTEGQTEVPYPFLTPLPESKDFLSQLLAAVEPAFVERIPEFLGPQDRRKYESQPQLKQLLLSGGGAAYPGDCGVLDAGMALEAWLTALTGSLKDRGLAPLMVLVQPLEFDMVAQHILEKVLTRLISQFGLKLVLLEEPEPAADFLGNVSSVTWTFPHLNWSRIEKESNRLGLALPPEGGSDTLLKSFQERGAALAHYFMALNDPQIGLLRAKDGTGDWSWQLLNAFDITHRKIYLVYLKATHLLDETGLIGFFAFLGEDPAIIKDKVDRLVEYGFLVFGSRRAVLRQDFLPLLNVQLATESKTLLTKLAEFLYSQWNKNRHLSEVVYGSLLHSDKPALALPVLTHYITLKINRGQGDFLPLLRKRLWDDVANTGGVRDRLTLLSAAFKLRYALNHATRRWDADDLEKFRKNFPEALDESGCGEWLLQKGRYLMATGKPGEAFPFLKKAQILAQEDRDPLLEIRSGTEIGLALVVRRRIDEAREYFEMAARVAERHNHLYNHCVNNGLNAVAQFLWGNLGECRKLLEQTEPKLAASGIQRWRLMARFLWGRLDFETGQYSKAEQTFAGARQLAQEYGLDEAFAVLDAWKARSLAYQQRWIQAIDLLGTLPETLETGFFKAEAYYMGRQNAKALEVLGKLTPEKGLRHYSGESVTWHSGFDLVENRLLAVNDEKGVLENLITAFRLYLEGQNKLTFLVQEGFQQLFSQKALLEVDPNAHLYYFWYYQVIPAASTENEALRLTILGRGLKALQTRASRIEERTEKVAFQSEPQWNGQLINEARKLKLL